MTKAMEEARAIALKPASLMRSIEYALRHSPVTETTFSEEGDFDVEIAEPASLEAFATALISEVAPEIIATALAARDAEIERLREALEFYAEVSKYPAPLTGGMGELWSDCGQVARRALTAGGQHG